VAASLTRERIAEAADAVANARGDLTEIAARIAETVKTRPAVPEPHYLDVYGAGALLHAYYNQAEQLFERIARELNSAPPKGPDWHRRLLDAMAAERPGVRPAVIGRDTHAQLREYLGFRHVFRRLYLMNLRWDRVRGLLVGIAEAHERLAQDLQRFELQLAELGGAL
jgi:hypothetical protein